MVEGYFNGDSKNATENQLKCMELIECLFCEVNPIPIKEALNIIGFDFGVPRLPLVKISEGNREKLEKIIKKII